MNVFFGALLAVLILVHVVFIFALKSKRNDLADVIWGPGFVVAALGALYAQWYTEFSLRISLCEGLILTLLTLWATRLFFHIGIRTLKKSDEDIRYKNMRASWGNAWVWKSYLYVFILQGLLMLVVGSSVISAIDLGPRDIDAMVITGAIIWIVGFIFEAISDKQLEKFKSNKSNKGRIMSQGLWSWSRHPNYFGEVVQWWGLFLMCVDPSNWWIIISPISITFLILKVSGVPLLEELMKSRPGFAEYKAKTSIFIPWPPKMS